MELLDFIILSLATWRISNLIVDEDGPWDILAKFRKFVGVFYDERSVRQGGNIIANAMVCVWCISIWIAAFITGIFLIAPEITIIVALPFAMSAFAIIIGEIINGNFKT